MVSVSSLGKQAFFVVVVGQLHKDASTERHPGNLTIYCHNTLMATAYQLICTTISAKYNTIRLKVYGKIKILKILFGKIKQVLFKNPRKSLSVKKLECYFSWLKFITFQSVAFIFYMQLNYWSGRYFWARYFSVQLLSKKF